MPRSTRTIWGLACGLILSGLIAGCAGGPSNAGTRAAPKGYVFWPPYPDEPRVQFLVSYSKSSDIEPAGGGGVLQSVVFGKETAASVLPIRKPYGVDMWNGRIYVCDIRGRAVVVLDLEAQETRLMGVTGTNALQRPTDVAVADDGMKYVTDLPRGLVVVFDADDRFAAVFGRPDFQPAGVTVRGDELFVTDLGSHQVVVLDRFKGQELRRIGGFGPPDEGGLSWPLGVEINSKGEVYVSDVLDAHVQVYDSEGVHQRTVGRMGTQLGGFVRPKCIAIDNQDRLFAVDAAFSNVQIFNPEGRLLTFFGGPGDYPGAMAVPAGISIEDLDAQTERLFGSYIHPAFEAEQFVVVTNQWGSQKVAVFALGKLRAGMTPDDVAPTRIEAPLGASEIPPEVDDDPTLPPRDANHMLPAPEGDAPQPTNPHTPVADEGEADEPDAP